MDSALVIFINLFGTVLVYGLLPILFLAFRRKPISQSSLKKFCILFTAISYVLLSVVFYFSDMTPSMPVAFLWGVIFYHILRAAFRSRGLLSDAAAPEPEKPVVDISDIPCEIVEEYRTEYPAHFTIRPPKPAEPAEEKKRPSGRPPVWCLALLIVLSLACAGAFLWAFSAQSEADASAAAIAELTEERDSLSRQLAGYKDMYQTLYEEYEEQRDRLDSLRGSTAWDEYSSGGKLVRIEGSETSTPTYQEPIDVSDLTENSYFEAYQAAKREATLDTAK